MTSAPPEFKIQFMPKRAYKIDSATVRNVKVKENIL